MLIWAIKSELLQHLTKVKLIQRPRVLHLRKLVNHLTELWRLATFNWQLKLNSPDVSLPITSLR